MFFHCFVWIIEETRGRDHVCREGGIDLKGRHLSRSVVQHWPASSQTTLNTGQYHVLGFCSGLTAYLLYAFVVEATKGKFSITYRERERSWRTTTPWILSTRRVTVIKASIAVSIPSGQLKYLRRTPASTPWGAFSWTLWLSSLINEDTCPVCT